MNNSKYLKILQPESLQMQKIQIIIISVKVTKKGYQMKFIIQTLTLGYNSTLLFKN
jgi:hypothetical protein